MSSLMILHFDIIPILIVIISFSFLGWIVFANNRCGITNRTFLIVCFIAIFYTIVNYLSYRITSREIILWVLRIVLFSAVWYSFFLFQLLYVIPNRSHSFPLWYKFILTPIVFLTAVITLTPLVFVRIDTVAGYGEVSNPVRGLGIILFGTVVVLLVLSSLYLIAKKTIRAKGQERNQLSFVLFGTIITFSLIIVFNLILPIIFNNLTFIPFAPVFFLPFIAFTTYSIVRHHLFDIKVIITRSLLFSILVLIVSTMFTTATLLVGRLIGHASAQTIITINILAAIAVVLLLNPLRNLLGRATDKIFFKGRMDYQTVAQKLSNLIAITLERDELLYKVIKSLSDEFKLKSANILFCECKDKMASLYYSTAPKPDQAGTAIKKHLWNEYATLVDFFMEYPDVKVREEEERKVEDMPQSDYQKKLARAVQGLDGRDIAVVVPILSSASGEAAFVFLSDKISGDIYDDRDIQLLELLQSQLASALEKSRLYEEVRAFNIKLTQKVKEKTEKLREANSHLRQLDKAKTLFLSVASHQLRTPLSGIKGFLSMVIEGDFGALTLELKKVLQDVYSNTNRLIRLVNTFLNVSRIEAGRLTVMKDLCDITALARKIVNELQFGAQDKGLILSLEAPDHPVMAILDSDKIEDVVINLTDNAIKYTEHGKIVVRIIDKPSSVRVEVQDTGQGLNHEEIKTLFHKFVRGSRGLSTHADGSGLGLYIAKRVVEMHNGKIGIESEGLGKGSIFWFEVPKE